MMEKTINGYSYCPTCRTQGIARTRGIPTYDMCGFGHKWLVSDGLSAEKISEFDVAQAEWKHKDALLLEMARIALRALHAYRDYEEPGDHHIGVEEYRALEFAAEEVLRKYRAAKAERNKNGAIYE